MAKWTQDIFIVKKVNYTAPVRNELKNEEDEDIIGRFYKNELQHTNY